MRRIITAAVVLMLLAGCGGSGSKLGVVEGTLTYHSQPVNGAALNLYPPGGKDPILIPVDQEGKFSTSDVPPGEYTVVVEGTAGTPGLPPMQGMSPEKLAEAKEKAGGMGTPPTIPFPRKYQSIKSSDMKVTIVAGKQTLTLDLTD